MKYPRLESNLGQRIGDIHDAERRVHIPLVAIVHQEDHVRRHKCLLLTGTPSAPAPAPAGPAPSAASPGSAAAARATGRSAHLPSSSVPSPDSNPTGTARP